VTDKVRDIFTATNRDKIRNAYHKGRRVITVEGIKLVLKSDKKGHILVKPEGNKKVPFALLDSKLLMEKQDKARREAIATHHKDVKSGEKKPRQPYQKTIGRKKK